MLVRGASEVIWKGVRSREFRPHPTPTLHVARQVWVNRVGTWLGGSDQLGSPPLAHRSLGHHAAQMAIVEAAVCVEAIYDAFQQRRARCLWVSEASEVPYPQVRQAKLERRALAAAAAPAKPTTLLLGYDTATYAEEERLRSAKATALAAKSTPAPRKDIYVKGAMDWEKQAWKVWDKKKVQEESRRDKYSTALTSYLGGNKLVHRFEPPAITQCAHCDLGGGLHPLRRCMGCMAVAYCCRAHQKQHWQWHKHICFAIRAANNLEAKRGEGAGWVKLRPRRYAPAPPSLPPLAAPRLLLLLLASSSCSSPPPPPSQHQHVPSPSPTRGRMAEAARH